MVDDDIASIFAAVARDIEPDLAVVIADATRQGLRRRARRRLAIVCAASASVVAVAVAATVAAHLASRTVHGAPPVGPGGRHHAHLAKPKAHHTRPPVPQAHGPGMMPTQMLAVLRTLLPPGTITYVASYPFSERGSLELNFNDSDGKGAVDIIISVAQTLTAAGIEAQTHNSITSQALSQQVRLAELYCQPPSKDEGKRPVGAAPQSCTRSALPNGDVVLRLVTGADFAGYYNSDVYLNRPDGVTVSIAVANGTLQGTPHLTEQGWPWVDRAVPPGSLAFWETVVASPKWHL